MKKIIFLPDNLASASEFAYIASKLGAGEVSVLYFDEGLKEKFEADDKNSSIEYFYIGGASGSVREIKKTTREKSFISRLKTVVKYSPRCFYIPWRLYEFVGNLYRIAKLLSGKEFTSCVVASDRSYASGYNFPALLYFRIKKVPIVIPPYSNFADAESMLVSRRKKTFEAGFLSKIFLRRFLLPCMESQNSYLYYPVDILAVIWLFGCMPKNPWVMGSNEWVTVCVTSIFFKEKLISLNVSSDGIFVTGSYKWDLKIKEKEFSGGRYKVGLGVPQLYEHGLMEWSPHIKNIENVIRSITLHKNFELFLCLHPKMDIEKYSFLVEKYSCQIEVAKTDSAIVDYDLYVATFSSTVFSALNYGVPCVVVDYYGLNYTMFNEYSSVSVIDDERSLDVLLSRYSQDEIFFAKCGKRALKDSRKINSFPGAGLDTLISLLRAQK